jgi:hypothetical protein
MLLPTLDKTATEGQDTHRTFRLTFRACQKLFNLPPHKLNHFFFFREADVSPSFSVIALLGRIQVLRYVLRIAV